MKKRIILNHGKKMLSIFFLLVAIITFTVLFVRCGFPFKKTLLVKLYGESGTGGGGQTGSSIYHNICTNASVNAQVLSSSGILYLGGDFTQVGICSGGGVILDLPGGDLTYPIEDTSFPMVHGWASVAISDSNGGYYVGGEFYNVGSFERNRVAHIDLNGNVTSFEVDVDEEVLSLALKSDGSVLYIGGKFTDVDGTTRNKVAAVNTNDGSLVNGFDPNVSGGFEPEVYALALSSDDSILYIGGKFTSVKGTTRNRIAAVNTNDGSVVGTFDPNASSTVYALALKSDDSILYMGGVFTTVKASTRNRIAAVTTADGNLVGTFDPNANSSVRSIALSSDNSILYLAGDFWTVKAITRNRVAAVTTADGNLVGGFDPDVDSTVYDIALSSDDSTLYLVGNFTTVKGATQNRIAAVKTADGTLVAGFDPKDPNDAWVLAVELNSSNSTLYVGGKFSIIDPVARTRVAAIDTADGSLVTGFAPNVDDDVYTLTLNNDDSILYIGGRFNNVEGNVRNNVAGLSTVDGSLIGGFVPSVDHTFTSRVSSMALSNDEATLYIGGYFNDVGGSTRNNVGAVSTVDGSVVGTFDPNVNNRVYTVVLNSDSSILYFGGIFTSVGGGGTNRLAAVTTVDGNKVGTFDPNVDGDVNCLAMTSNDSILYLGGGFSTVGGAGREKIAAVNTNNGTIVATFNPNANGSVDSLVLSSDESVLFMGGGFDQIDGVDRNLLAQVNTNNGTLVNGFDADVDAGEGEGVLSLVLNADGSTLYLGGEYLWVRENARNNFATVNTSDGSLVTSIFNTIKEKVEKIASFISKILSRIYDSFLIPKAQAQEQEKQGLQLTWSEIEGAQKYLIEISETEDFTEVVVEEELLKSEYFFAVPKPGTYYWRTSAIDVLGNRGTPSEVGVMEIELEAPISKGSTEIEVLIDEAKGPYGKKNLSFKWEKNRFAEKYEIMVSDSEDFENAKSKIVDQALTNMEVDLKKVIYWKVRALDKEGEPVSEFSEVNTITVNFEDKLETPFFVFPPENRYTHYITPEEIEAGGAPTPIITLEWSSIDRAKAYQVRVSKSPSFRKIIKNKYIYEEESFDFRFPLPKGENYYVQVRASTKKNRSEWSDILHITSLSSADKVFKFKDHFVSLDLVYVKDIVRTSGYMKNSPRYPGIRLTFERRIFSILQASLFYARGKVDYYGYDQSFHPADTITNPTFWGISLHEYLFNFEIGNNKLNLAPKVTFERFDLKTEDRNVFINVDYKALKLGAQVRYFFKANESYLLANVNYATIFSVDQTEKTSDDIKSKYLWDLSLSYYNSHDEKWHWGPKFGYQKMKIKFNDGMETKMSKWKAGFSVRRYY